MADKAAVSTSAIDVKVSTEADSTSTTVDSVSNLPSYRYALIQGDLPPDLIECRQKLEILFKSIKLDTIDSVQGLEKLSPVSDGQMPMAIKVIFANQCQLQSNLELMSKSRVTSEIPELILYFLIQSDDMPPKTIKEEMSNIPACDHWKTKYPNTFLIYKGGDSDEIKSFVDELSNLIYSDAIKQDTTRFRCISKVLKQLTEIQTKRQFQCRNGLEKTLEVAGFHKLDGVLKFGEHWKLGNWYIPIDQVSNDEVMKEVQHSECYDTSGDNRVLIINNENFIGATSTRFGAHVDVENLRDLFLRLKYHVDVRRDLSEYEMMQAVENFSNRDEPDISSCVLVIMSHGTEGKLRSKDGHDVSEEKLLNIFGSGQNLMKKPRLVVIQSCRNSVSRRGSEVDDANPTGTAQSLGEPISLDEPVQVRKPKMAENWFGEHYFGSAYVAVDNSPDRAGMIIAHSTLPGDPANRNELKGSRFITALCMVYHANADKMDVVSMINMVNASMTQVNKEGTPAAQQLASWTIQTTKKYYLAKTPQAQKREE